MSFLFNDILKVGWMCQPVLVLSFFSILKVKLDSPSQNPVT